MKFVDLSGSSRLVTLMDLTRALRNCRSPFDALLMYCNYLREVNPGRAHIVLSTAGLSPGEYRLWRFLRDDGTEHLPLCNPWENLTLPIHTGGLLSRIVEQATPHLVHDIDWIGDPHFAEMFQ